LIIDIGTDSSIDLHDEHKSKFILAAQATETIRQFPYSLTESQTPFMGLAHEVITDVPYQLYLIINFGGHI